MPSVTVAQAETMFLESIGPRRSANTIQTYRKALETFSNMLVAQQIDPMKLPINELTENSIVQFVDYMKDRSPATESLYLQVIKSFFEFLDAENYTSVNPSRVRLLIRKRRRRSGLQPSEYPENDIIYLLDFISNLQSISSLDRGATDNSKLRDVRDRALILTLADTGLRVDEICKLRCGDIDWERSRAILNESNQFYQGLFVLSRITRFRNR